MGGGTRVIRIVEQKSIDFFRLVGSCSKERVPNSSGSTYTR